MKKIIDRKAAKADGLKHYFTGRPCRRGGIAERRVSDHSCCCKLCLSAASAYQRSRYASVLKHDPKFVEQNRARARKWAMANQDKQRQRFQTWVEVNSERWAEIRRAANLRYHRVHKDDPDYQVRKRARSLVEKALASMGTYKSRRLHSELGYTGEDLRQHIESRMQPWMSWDNYGSDWEIDHVVPINELIKLGVNDMRIINRLDNLQPLSCSDNAAKGDSFVLGVQLVTEQL